MSEKSSRLVEIDVWVDRLRQQHRIRFNLLALSIGLLVPLISCLIAFLFDRMAR